MPMADSQRPKGFSIAIVGGGIGGLCLAVALHHHGVPFHVYEAAAEFSEIGAGLGLGPNAVRALELLDAKILEGYQRCVTTNFSPAEQGRFFNFRYGMEKPSSDGMKAMELICEVRSGGTTSSVHRARFLSELVKLLPVEKASFGRRLVSLNSRGEGVILRFADGTTAKHDAVIGCDGIKSQVRKELLGKQHPAGEAVFSGKCCYRALAPADKAIEVLGKELATESQMYLGKHGHVLTTLIEQGRTVNVVAYTSSRSSEWKDGAWVKPGTKAELLTKYEDFCEPVKKVLGLVDSVNMWALFDHLPIRSYHQRGKICLLGDAAHASTPHHGAAAGMAVEDALVLTKLLASIHDRSQLEAVFFAYDAVRRDRSQRLRASSRQVGAIYDLEDPKIGDDMAKTAIYLLNAWDWIWNEDVSAQLSKALSLRSQRSRARQSRLYEREVSTPLPQSVSAVL